MTAVTYCVREPPVGIEPTTYSLGAHFAMPVMWAHTPVTCTPASIKVHWRPTVSTAVVTQLVTHLGAIGSLVARQVSACVCALTATWSRDALIALTGVLESS
jgi:hypothetical protein